MFPPSQVNATLVYICLRQSIHIELWNFTLLYLLVVFLGCFFFVEAKNPSTFDGFPNPKIICLPKTRPFTVRVWTQPMWTRYERKREREGGGVRQSSNGENSPTFTRNKLTRHYIALEYLLSVSYSHIWLLVVLMLLLLLGGWVALHEKRVYIASIENKPV